MDETSSASTPFPAPALLMAAIAEPLAGWMREQRWSGARSSAGLPEVTVLGTALVEETPVHEVLAVVVRMASGGRSADYQVPLLIRPAGAETEPGALIAEVPGEAAGGGQGALQVLDATRTPEGREALLGLVVASSSVLGDGLELTGTAVPGRGAGHVASSRLLSGEQSNSSMIFELDGAAPVIVKLFRLLQVGQNPDVVLQGVLDAAGSEQVAPLIGSAAIRWDAGEGHSLFAQEFFPGVQDAWRVALGDAIAGTDFTEGARTLGEATAQVHLDLAAQLPTIPADHEQKDRMVASMLARLDETAVEVPAVDAAAAELRTALRQAEEVPWPPFQRVHGDYHLGQVLAVPGRGWVLLDFEGEPMRPLAERELPDCPVRDVAGMLRSLDYAAGAVRLEHGKDASAWAEAARAAFLDGYGRRSGIDVTADDYARLLAAFEADKAVYEVLYEARNRPDWIDIPLAALTRIAG